MAKPDLDRLERTRAALAAAKLDALVVRLPENVLLLSGQWPLAGATLLLFPLEGEPLLVAPVSEQAEVDGEAWPGPRRFFDYGVLGAPDMLGFWTAALGEHGRRLGRVGVELGFDSVAPAWNAGETLVPAAAYREMLARVWGRRRIVDATGLLHGLRARKTTAEIAAIRRANEIAALGLDLFLRAVEVGSTGVELVAAVESEILKRGTGLGGARRVRAFAQVSTGVAETARAWRPMVTSTTTPLAEGDHAMLELGVVADGFWADRTRVRVAGRGGERLARAARAVAEAQAAAIAVVRAGVTASTVDAAARNSLKAAGFETEFFHVTGHGLGLRYHEPTPLIHPGSAVVLEEGMVHSVEPGVYGPDFGGFRLEENVAVTAGGAEVLGPCAAGIEAP